MIIIQISETVDKSESKNEEFYIHDYEENILRLMTASSQSIRNIFEANLSVCNQITLDVMGICSTMH